MAKMYIEAVECFVCKKLHRAESSSFLTVEGNILIGEADGIVGASEWENGEAPVHHFCPECLVKIIQSGGKIRSFEPLREEESERTCEPDESMKISLLPLSFKGSTPPSHTDSSRRETESWWEEAEEEFESEQEATRKALETCMEVEVQIEPELELLFDEWSLD